MVVFKKTKGGKAPKFNLHYKSWESWGVSNLQIKVKGPNHVQIVFFLAIPKGFHEQKDGVSFLK